MSSIFDNPKYQMAQTRRMIENSHRMDMQQSSTMRMSRTLSGESGLLTDDEIRCAQNSRSWTSGLSRPHP